MALHRGRERERDPRHWLPPRHDAGPVASGGLAGGQATLAGASIVIGGFVLAACWVGLLGTGHGGVVAAIASAGAPFAILYFRAHVHERFYLETTIAIAGLGFGVFAGGHLIARRLTRGARIAAGVALVSIVVAFTSEATHAEMAPGTLELFYLGAFGGLTATSLALAFDLRALGQRAREKRALAGNGTTPTSKRPDGS